MTDLFTDESEQNKLPVLILGLTGVVLCLAGALQMSKLRMQGYYLWLGCFCPRHSLLWESKMG
jgi:hypothetical protein